MMRLGIMIDDRESDLRSYARSESVRKARMTPIKTLYSLPFLSMARIIFENDNKSKRIIVTVREEEESTKFDVHFKPTHTKEDFDSNHYHLFQFFVRSLDKTS